MRNSQTTFPRVRVALARAACAWLLASAVAGQAGAQTFQVATVGELGVATSISAVGWDYDHSPFFLKTLALVNYEVTNQSSTPLHVRYMLQFVWWGHPAAGYDFRGLDPNPGRDNDWIGAADASHIYFRFEDEGREARQGNVVGGDPIPGIHFGDPGTGLMNGADVLGFQTERDFDFGGGPIAAISPLLVPYLDFGVLQPGESVSRQWYVTLYAQGGSTYAWGGDFARQAVPEPFTMALLAAGLAVAIRARRKSKT
jgi:hypothetical protein